jgi:hemolysin activation/secretion protein
VRFRQYKDIGNGIDSLPAPGNVPALLACLTLSFALLLLPSPPSLAQGAPRPGEQDLIRDRQQKLLEEQQRRLEELRRLPPAPPAPASAQPPAPGPCVPVKSIRLEGAGRLHESERRALVAPYEGQCLDESRLNALLANITQFYLDRGLITTRAYLPPQDASGGALQVKVLEGRLEAITSAGIPSEREIAMAFPGKTGEALNVRELEQMLDQLGRLPSRAVTLDLTPGAGPGASIAQARAEPQKPWRAALRLDNSGLKSTGERQLGAYLTWDSPLGLADQLALAAGRDAFHSHRRLSDNQSLYYSLPSGWWSFNYSYSRNSYKYQASLYGMEFENRGETEQHRLRAERLLHRDSASKTSAAIGISHLRTDNFFEGIRLGVSSYKLSELELSLSHGRRIRNAFLNIEAGWQRGTGALHAQKHGHPQGAEPDPRYDKYTLTLSALAPFTIKGEHFSAESLAYGQKSDAPLFSLHRVALGGLDSVRGFKDQVLYGNSGGYWRNQLRWRKEAGWPPHFKGYSIALLYDLGAVHRHEGQGDPGARLSGAGIELAAQGERLAASLTYARALTKPKNWEREHPFYFNVSLIY